MATATNIVLADALATPVNHTFIPMGKDQNGVYWFEDQSQSNALGYWRLSVEVKRPLPGAPGAVASSDRVARVKLAMHEPTLETLGTADNGLTPPPTISHISRCTKEYVLPEKGSKLERQHLRKMSTNLESIALIVSCIEDLQPITG